MGMDILSILKKERRFILYSLLAGSILLYAYSRFKNAFAFPGLENRVLFALIIVVIIIIVDFLATGGFFSRIEKLKISPKRTLDKILCFFTFKNTLLIIFLLFLALTILSFLKLKLFFSDFLASVQLPLVLTTAIIWMIIYFLGRKNLL